MEKGPQANAGQPALVLLDVGLPGIDGYGVCGCIRATLELRAAVLSAHTSYGQDSDRKKSFGGGFDHQFVNPCDLARFCRISERRLADHVNSSVRDQELSTRSTSKGCAFVNSDMKLIRFVVSAI